MRTIWKFCSPCYPTLKSPDSRHIDALFTSVSKRWHGWYDKEMRTGTSLVWSLVSLYMTDFHLQSQEAFVCLWDWLPVSSLPPLLHEDFIYVSARLLHPCCILRLFTDPHAMKPLLIISDAIDPDPLEHKFNVVIITFSESCNDTNCFVSCAWKLIRLHKRTIHVPSHPPDRVTIIPRRDDCWVVMSKLLKSKLGSALPWISTSGSISPSLSLSKNDCRAGEILTSIAALILIMKFTQLSDVYAAF